MVTVACVRPQELTYPLLYALFQTVKATYSVVPARLCLEVYHYTVSDLLTAMVCDI